MDLLIRVHVEGPLDEGEGHLQGLHSELGTVLSDELQPLYAHQATVAGGVLLQVLQASGKISLIASFDYNTQALFLSELSEPDMRTVIGN